MRKESWVTAKYPLHNSHVLEFRRNERKVSRELKYVGKLIEVKDPHGIIHEFASHMMQEDYSVGLVVANHDQHANVMAFVDVADTVNLDFVSKAKVQDAGSAGHDLIVTISLLNGDQGENLQRFALGMRPTLAEQGIEMIGIMRKKDRDEFYESSPKKRGPEAQQDESMPNAMQISSEYPNIQDGDGEVKKQKKTRHELHGDIKKSMRNVNRLKEDFLSGRIIWFFPAGTTIEGTINAETGKPYGMDDIDNGVISVFIREAIKNNKKMRILPLSLNGFNNIAPARETKATKEAARAIKWNLATLGLKRKTLAEVIPNELINPEQLMANGLNLEDEREVNRVVLSAIAKNVTPERQGIFAASVPREGFEPSRV